VIDPWLVFLIAKMAVAAAVVVGCSLLAERFGPLVAAMIATLPISAGPVYVFLALEHDAAFLSESALGSMQSNLANTALSLVYVLMAQRFGTLASLSGAMAAWFALALGLRLVEPSFLAVVAATVLGFGALHRLFRPYLAARPPALVERPWYAIPLRAAGVALLAGTVTVLSSRVGPLWSGMLAAFPVVLSSMIAMLQPRIGGPAVAAVIANGALGLIGFGLALASIHLSAVALGSWPALGLGLAICVVWNLALMGLKRGAR
jgi:hypothetical protein